VTPDTSHRRRARRRGRGARGAAVATAAALACSAFALVGAGGAAAGAASSSCPWAGSSAPIATRVAKLLGAMTLDDKLAMVDGIGFTTGTAGYVGSIAANPRLCIPALNLEDGPQGVACQA